MRAAGRNPPIPRSRVAGQAANPRPISCLHYADRPLAQLALPQADSYIGQAGYTPHPIRGTGPDEPSDTARHGRRTRSDAMMWLALLGALAIGVSLGLLGSGGSILTVPVLVYLVGQPEKVAIAGSLAIVGGVALAGAIPWTIKREVDWRSVFWFGLPGMVGTWLGASISRWIPGPVQLFLFALVMLAAAWMMFRPTKVVPDGYVHVPRLRLLVVIDGLGVGVLTGLVGVGGGFLILPALVLLGGLAMHRAIGTSLWIIALKSFSGFAKYVSVLGAAGLTLDWRLIGIFTAVGAGGSLVGQQLAGRLPQQKLKKVFSVFLVLMGVFIVARTAPGLFGA